MRCFLILAFMMIAAVWAKAQSPVVVHAQGQDSTIVIIQPEELDDLLNPEKNPQPKEEPKKQEKKEDTNKPKVVGEKTVRKIIGYRVQVFSDNNPSTAKNAARQAQGQVRGRFPQYRSYVMYSAPYWRVRVGDFETQGEASAAASRIRGACPKLGQYIRVVKDRVTIIE